MTHVQHHLTSTDPSPDTGPGGPPTPPVSPTRPRGLLAAVWNGLTAVVAALMGLAPHVLHHIGLFAGAAFSHCCVVSTAGSEPGRPPQSPSPSSR